MLWAITGWVDKGRIRNDIIEIRRLEWLNMLWIFLFMLAAKVGKLDQVWYLLIDEDFIIETEIWSKELSEFMEFTVERCSFIFMWVAIVIVYLSSRYREDYMSILF